MKSTIDMMREACDKDKVDAWQNDFWTITQEELERLVVLVRADEAAKYTWDVHSCGPTCTKAACVAMREAVEAEREALLDLVDDYAKNNTDLKAAIRARGNT